MSETTGQLVQQVKSFPVMLWLLMLPPKVSTTSYIPKGHVAVIIQALVESGCEKLPEECPKQEWCIELRGERMPRSVRL
jgi:hypothetical protein